MDFKHIKVFTDENLAQKKLRYSNETAIKLTCFYHSDEQNKEMIVGGTTVGYLMIWTKKNNDQKFLTWGKEFDVKDYTLPNQHKGEIRCISFENIEGHNFFVTGSADRSIKIWESDMKNKGIVQTLAGHGGTVLQIKYASQIGTLISCSIDKTIRTWILEPGRKMMLYPSFLAGQVISHYSDKPLIETKNLFISSIGYKSGDNPGVVAGDSEGTIYFFKQDENTKEFSPETLVHQKHRITIIQTLVLPKENMLFTISFDQKINGFEFTTGKSGPDDPTVPKLFYTFKNPFKLIFTCMVYDATFHELFVGDEAGNVWDLSVHTQGDFNRIHPFDKKILGISYFEKYSQLLLCTETGVEVLKIQRGVNVQNLIGTHKGPVIKIIECDPQKLTQQPTRELPKLFSTSIDNTIRQWNVLENEAVAVFDSEKAGEICTMILLKKSCLIATGHDDGNVMIWNTEIGKPVLLQNKKKQKPHKDIVCCLASGIVSDFTKADRDSSKPDEEKEFLFTSGYDGRVVVWELFEKSGPKSTFMDSTVTPQHKCDYSPFPERKEYENVGKEILSLLFDAGTGLIYAAGNTCEVYVHKLHHQKEPEYVTTIRDDRDGHLQAISCMAIDKNILFTGSEDHTIKLWELINFEIILTLRQHENPINDMLIIEETGHLVSCSIDGKIYIWNYPKSKVEKTIEKNEGFLCLAYSFKYKQIYAGTEQNNLLCFPIEEVFEKDISEMSFDMEQVSLLPDSPKKRTISPIREEAKVGESFEYLSEDGDVLDSPHTVAELGRPSGINRAPSMIQRASSMIPGSPNALQRAPSMIKSPSIAASSSKISPQLSPDSPQKKTFTFK